MEVSISLRLPTELVQQIDAWRASQAALPSRQQFIRYVVAQFFQQTAEAPPKRKSGR